MSSRVAIVVFSLVVALPLATASLVGQAPERRAGTAPRFFPDDPMRVDDDMQDVAPMAPLDLSKSYEFVRETFGGSAHSFGPALNVNTLGEVPDSSWFTNRIGQAPMSIEEVLRGPDRVDGPAAGPWLVTGRPDAGITPKFTIRDARGDTYLIKLDPAVAPELPSSVEFISTKIFHAIGYHVPEDYLVTFDPARLEIAPGARTRTADGRRRAIRRDDVVQWLQDVPRALDGEIRVIASRYVPGTVVGQFRFSGRRPDDPNDLYPHERRRELRGLRVFAAWLHHDDARSLNSIDTYVTDGGRRYVRHYLQDFGSNLGSGSTSAQQPRGGYEYLIDGSAIARGLFSLGLWQRGWMHATYPSYPAVGNVEADFFEPARWKTEYPQPAFDQMDDADAFWAARIASRFTDGMLRSLVEVARLSDRDASRYLSEVLIRRRDKVVAHWLTQTTPLDAFTVAEGPGGPLLAFENAAVAAGVAPPDQGYAVRWSSFDNAGATESTVGVEAHTDASRLAIPADAWGPHDAHGARYAVAAIGVRNPAYPRWTQPVRVTLRERAGTVDVVGLERPTGGARRGR